MDGQCGTETLDFFGANVAENIDIASDSWIRVFRDIAKVTTDLSGMETPLFHALGGADAITVNALSGTLNWQPNPMSAFGAADRNDMWAPSGRGHW